MILCFIVDASNKKRITGKKIASCLEYPSKMSQAQEKLFTRGFWSVYIVIKV